MLTGYALLFLGEGRRPHQALAVIFAGGGACWTGENCALRGKSFYRPFAGLEDGPREGGGVFDTDNPETRSLTIPLPIFLPPTEMSFSATRLRPMTYLQWADSLRAK
jgi:hypothetical protein